MIRILFVDDEQRILDGLKRMLRPTRLEWETEFANSGAQALEALDRSRFDVIVTDMRMPAMDGATLLREAADRHPYLVRIVLSGHSEMESIMKSAGVAHQYLSKPCPLDELKLTLTRALALRRLLSSSHLKDLASQLNIIPSVPALYFELNRLLDSPYTTISQIGDIIAKDMGMCAKVLQLANSAFFGRRRSMNDPGEAAAYLGFDTLKSLVLGVHIFEAFKSPGIPGFHLDALWQHSLTTSRLAGEIAKSLPSTDGQLGLESQIAGLLHDVGQLVMACNLPAKYEEVLKIQKAAAIDSVQAELEVFHVSHAEVGAYILALWGLSDPIIEAIAFHHVPGLAASGPASVLTAVHAADALIRDSEESNGARRASKLDLAYLEKAGVSDRLAQWQTFHSELCPKGPATELVSQPPVDPARVPSKSR